MLHCDRSMCKEKTFIRMYAKRRDLIQNAIQNLPDGSNYDIFPAAILNVSSKLPVIRYS